MTRKEFIIRVDKAGDEAEVTIEVSNETDEDFGAWMCACEYLLHKTAQKSHAGYEQALELLTQGAMAYKEEKQ